MTNSSKKYQAEVQRRQAKQNRLVMLITPQGARALRAMLEEAKHQREAKK